MLDIKITTVYPCVRTDGQQTREYFVRATVNGHPSDEIFPESQLTKEMRNELRKWFVQMYYHLPKDMQTKIKSELK